MPHLLGIFTEDNTLRNTWTLCLCITVTLRRRNSSSQSISLTATLRPESRIANDMQQWCNQDIFSRPRP